MEYPFSKYLYQDENTAVEHLLERVNWSQDIACKVHDDAVDLVSRVREHTKNSGQMEAFFQEFSLTSREGVALMSLAEALLRIPDAATANAMIKDKVTAASWLEKQGDSPKDWMTKAAGFGMVLSQKTLNGVFSKIGQPFIREAMVRAMQIMGKQFVLGETIDNALSNSGSWAGQGYLMSYDMLGEGARDASTADQYYISYHNSIDALLVSNGQSLRANAGISVKLSALHPRYCFSQKARCIPHITEKLKALCVKAASGDLPLTIDAEEASRLDLSIEIIENLLSDPDLEGWDGLGLAVQAYQKRAVHLIDYIADIARKNKRKVQIRLVKGAYWDAEIKLAQIGGFVDYPVFTRKCHTDLSYLVCAQAMLSHRDVIYSMFATHNAHTIAAIRVFSEGGAADYEFQRLYGMGDGVYHEVMRDRDIRVRVYAPVGPHRDLLPYLVRRLLENGANSSFVNKLLDRDIPAVDLVSDPVALARSKADKRHPSIALPRMIYGQNRLNSYGCDVDDHRQATRLEQYVRDFDFPSEVKSIVDGRDYDVVNTALIERAFSVCGKAFLRWDHTSVCIRATIIERCADMLEHKMDEFIAILILEAGKTYTDARDEVREAVDFCRYYALCARTDFDAVGIMMQGYTGESNRLMLCGRGIFISISPWNFPLAIFTGQVVAALLAGNTVIAKPASQTRYVARYMVDLMHQAGVPKDVLHLILGDGKVGGRLVSDPRVGGVVFTGSTATAKRIQMSLAEHNNAIVPFIAETGGQNAMIVDSTALPEQVVDDVIHSAFGSAGQRCSALRVLYVQEDIAPTVIKLIKGAMAELSVGDPVKISTDIGYIIDEDAKSALDRHIDYISSYGQLIARTSCEDEVCYPSRLFMPAAFEIDDISILKEEVFGPVLHIIRFNALDLGDVIERINANGYGLTFGLHSRISSRHERIAQAVRAGNIYINRSMTGAVVGVQPFGGMGMSGTGPKAGGPHYVRAFGVEKHVSIDTTASGGNASLVSIDEDA